MENIIKHNQKVWDGYVKVENKWTVPVSSAQVQNAKNGSLELYLTPSKTVPLTWFPKDINNKKILCLASGGGQQSILFAATGADVTVFDLSEKQLEQDQKTAQREALSITAIQGDMRDLSIFDDEYFHIVFCPVSITYIPELDSLFQEIYRILKPQGIFMLGATNPHVYLYDLEKWDKNIFEVANSLPHCSLDDVSEQQQETYKQAIEYSHTFDSIIGGQLKAGFMIDQFFEDKDDTPITQYFQNYFATRAIKVGS